MLLPCLVTLSSAQEVAPSVSVTPHGRVFFRPEVTVNYTDYDDSVEDSGWIFTLRSNLAADVALPRDVHAVIDLQSYGTYAIDLGKDAGVGKGGTGGAPLDANLRLYQGYIEVRDMGRTPLDLRVGRMELGTWGTGMLVAADRFNDGFSLESLQLRYDTPAVEATLLWAQLYADVDTSADGQDWLDPVLVGTHATLRASDVLAADAYVWGVVSQPFGGYIHTTGTFGVRPFGAAGALDYSAEAALQLGSGAAVFDETDTTTLRAYAVDPRVGVTFGPARLGAAFYRASGDQTKGDGVLTTFNPLWQDPHGRFGNLDRFKGTNLQSERLDLSVRLGAQPEAVVLTVDGYALQAVTAADAAHGAFSGGPTEGAGTFLGYGGDFGVEWPFSPNLTVSFDASAFAPGPYARASMGTDDPLLRIYSMVDATF